MLLVDSNFKFQEYSSSQVWAKVQMKDFYKYI